MSNRRNSVSRWQPAGNHSCLVRLAPPKSQRNRSRGIRLLVTVALCCLCLGCAPTEPREEEDPSVTEPVPVQAVKAERRTLLPTIDLVGAITVIPEQTAVVATQTSGWIQKVLTVDGAVVTAGDLVVSLDARTAEVDLAMASAAVAEKEAALARLQRGYLPQEIEMARDDLLRATQQAESLQAELDALVPLWKQKEISDLQHQKAQLALRSAQAAQAVAEAKLRLYQAGTPREELDEAKAQLATAKAALDAAKLNLEFCQISAPITGTVTQSTARRGMFVERAAPLLTIANLEKLFLEVRIPVAFAAQVTPGAPVKVFLSRSEAQSQSATVTRIRGQADSTTGDWIASIEIANASLQLRPGMTCRAQLSLPELPHVLVVPVQAVADRSGTPVVTVVRDGAAHEIEVVPGTRTHDFVEITRGLNAGDWVVTQGGYGLPDGCPVKIVQRQVAEQPETP